MTERLITHLIGLGDFLKLLPFMTRAGLGDGWPMRKKRNAPDLTPEECEILAPELRKLEKRINDLARAMERRARGTKSHGK